MSIPERIFNLSKAYLKEVRERIDTELSDAERELDSTPGSRSIDEGAMNDDLSSHTDPAAMMRRAEARIAAARREMEARNEERASQTEKDGTTSVPAARPSPATASTPAASDSTSTNSGLENDPNYHDYRLLGVPVGGDLAQVQSGYEQLTRRCDPRRFPEGSAEQKEAARILQRVNNAFDALRIRLDPNAGRFAKLELE